MSSRLYIISGSSGSGKTELLDLIQNQATSKAVLAPKYSTRNERKGEFDDIRHVDRIDDEEYTFVYPMNNYTYGIKAEEITDLLGRGYNVFIILSDLRIVEEVKQFFGSIAVSLYIFRNLSADQLEKVLEEREMARGINPVDTVPLERQRQTRLNRLYFIQRKYVDNITLFDHIILNIRKPQDMLQQVINLVEGYENGIVHKDMRGPVIFLIAAAPGAGKRTLTTAMYGFGRKSITVVKKATTRKIHDDDGPEIYHVDEINHTKFNINYSFHDKYTEYGIETGIMWQNLSKGRSQILITNMQQFRKFREMFGPLVVCVYLHATRTMKQLFEWQVERHGDEEKAKRKVEELDRIHQDYISNIAEFQHVLLNTLEKEDFWEQMLRLMRFYRDR
ncbi:MAG: Guanylate kinase [Candidatus Argoarchaeum ethanivorans]|uniref:Guanylate kinase n=1 Tax=Candidatus Argoarchaeum ethanivorans TaxID=2608793 RepID=A0A811TIH4_9EURY|nr:MAG: Guanylate kinase [Candidatus Argoarchaeum ethanivorans]